MGRRAKVTLLPEAERAALNQWLVAHGFGEYEKLSDLLGEHGYHIARSSLQRFGSQFERKLEAIFARISTGA
jgi:hypothetical protein